MIRVDHGCGTDDGVGAAAGRWGTSRGRRSLRGQKSDCGHRSKCSVPVPRVHQVRTSSFSPFRPNLPSQPPPGPASPWLSQSLTGLSLIDVALCSLAAPLPLFFRFFFRISCLRPITHHLLPSPCHVLLLPLSLTQTSLCSRICRRSSYDWCSAAGHLIFGTGLIHCCWRFGRPVRQTSSIFVYQ